MTSLAGTLDGGIGGGSPRPTLSANGSLVSGAVIQFVGTANCTEGTVLGYGVDVQCGAYADASTSPTLTGENQTLLLSINNGSPIGTLSVTASSGGQEPTAGTATCSIDFNDVEGSSYAFNCTARVQITNFENNTGTIEAFSACGYTLWENIPFDTESGIACQSLAATADIGGIDFSLGYGSYASEVLVLDQPEADRGSPLGLAGGNLGAICTSLRAVLDGNTSTVGSFSPGNEWTGIGPLATAGEHTLYVFDASSLVQSNTVTFTVGYPIRQVQFL